MYHDICDSGLTAFKFKIARAAKHFWEEPVLSGKEGSGTIFFCGCGLRCVYCQNYQISRGGRGIGVTGEQLVLLMLHLQREGAHNVNLVTPSHYAARLPEVLRLARDRGLTIPIVYNSGGYDGAEDLKNLAGLIDIYLPDFKYADNAMAKKYSDVSDYAETAVAAITEMRRQQPHDVFYKGLMQKGVIVRHLVLPGQVENSYAALRKIAGIDPSLYVSLMAQYFPPAELKTEKYPTLSRRITKEEYASVRDYFFTTGLKYGFMQDASSAIEDYVPDFDTEELIKTVKALSDSYADEP